MNGMNTQERYEDISKISGLSEDIIRRVFNASKKSIAKSLKKGERATLPGLFTVRPEIRTKLNIGGTSVSQYIKLKASVSETISTELEKLSNFEGDSIEESNDEALKKLRIINTEHYVNESTPAGIRTSQISALL